MTAHSDKRLDKARSIAHESGISVRQAYRRLRNIEVSEENDWKICVLITDTIVIILQLVMSKPKEPQERS